MTDDQGRARPGRTNRVTAVPAWGGCRRGWAGDQGRGRRGRASEQNRATSGHSSMQVEKGCDEAAEPWQLVERIASTWVNRLGGSTARTRPLTKDPMKLHYRWWPNRCGSEKEHRAGHAGPGGR